MKSPARQPRQPPFRATPRLIHNANCGAGCIDNHIPEWLAVVLDGVLCGTPDVEHVGAVVDNVPLRQVLPGKEGLAEEGVDFYLRVEREVSV